MPENQQEPNSQNLSEAISKEIAETSIDLGIEYAEISLDAVFSEDIVKEIPILKTLYAVGRVGYQIKERFFAKKLLTFLKEFHNKKIESQKLDAFRDKFEQDHKYREKVTELIMVYNDSFLDVEKSKIFARLFSAHISGAFDWNQFRHLTSCLNNLQYQGFQLLSKLADSNFEIPEDRDENSPPRDYDNEALLSARGIA